MVTFTITMIIISIFLISGVAVHMYIRPSFTPRQIIKHEKSQGLHDVIFAGETTDEDRLLLTNL